MNSRRLILPHTQTRYWPERSLPTFRSSSRRKGRRIVNQPLTADDAQLMWDGMAIQPLRSIPEYLSLVESVGLKVISSKDLTEEWGPILKERLAMYQRLREEARQAGTPMGHDAFHKSYVRFVELIQERKMGGVRIVATKQ
jgi:sarcosine/dimethylglycine N-methyltransferase